jgi:hypothetical protein
MSSTAATPHPIDENTISVAIKMSKAFRGGGSELVIHTLKSQVTVLYRILKLNQADIKPGGVLIGTT